jgi:sugar phosphate isomerase/epimerase
VFLGYNTNGLAHHDLFDAVELLAEIGYRGVAITIDHNALPPSATAGSSRNVGLPRETLLGKPAVAPTHVALLKRLLETLGMRSVIETGARFLLDPRVKHEPTLLSEDRRRRIDFHKYAIDCAAELGSDCVSLWSGALGTGPFFGGKTDYASERLAENMDLSPLAAREAMDRLVDGLREVLDYAAASNVLIGFEPEPGMFIDTMGAFERLLSRMSGGPDIPVGGADIPVGFPKRAAADRQECLSSWIPGLQLTLDVGHLHCQGETPIADMIRRWAPRLVNVHLEDMRAGRHEHLMFGEGEMDFPPVLRTLAEVGYTGGVCVELSRHSHEGPAAARRAFEFLTRMMNDE